MAKAYKEYKVSELKELLSKRGLPTSGTKNELIGRLEENDAQKPEEEPEAEPVEETPAETEKATENDNSQETTNDDKADETTDKPTTEEAAPEEDPKEAALNDLRKRIERAKKFHPEDVAALETQAKRIERFGPPTVPAVSKPQSNSFKKSRNRRRNKN